MTNADLVLRNGKIVTVDKDFCILGRDILSVDPHEIGEIPVLMTIVGGKIVFDKISG